MAWCESGLLNFSMVVLWVSIQGHLTNLMKWIITMWPDLGDIKYIESVVGSVFLWHQLYKPSPGWEIFRSDGVIKISS